MHWQVEIDELAEKIEKGQLQRWEESQEKVESCKSVAELFPQSREWSSKRNTETLFLV